MTNYKSGRYFEYELKKRYEKQGAYVIRSAGSHGLADLIVIYRDKKPLLVQVKFFSGSVPKPSQEFRNLKASGFRKIWIAKRKWKHGSQFEYEVE